MTVRLGMCFDRSFPAGAIVEYASALEAAGLDELWVIEDCFYTAGVSLAATALAVTDELSVGLGILPAVARNPAITAMEIATLANIAPQRLIAGIGHGVQSWMGQMGARTPSPLTTLDEVVTVVRRLLAGEEVTFHGREVHFEAVGLDQPPVVVPPVLAGVEQVKSLAVAGRVADGVVFGEGAGPTYVAWAREAAGRPEPFEIATFTIMSVDADRRSAYHHVVELVAELVRQERRALTVLPFFDEMRSRVDSGGAAALLDMPADHWGEIGAIGTIDDAVAHVEALGSAGVSHVTVFPGPDLDTAHALVGVVAEVRSLLAN